MRNRRTLGPISKLELGLAFGVEISDGQGQNRGTSGSFQRLTGGVRPLVNILVYKITWDVRNAGTYLMRFVDAINSTTSVMDIGTVSVGGTGTITWYPDEGHLILFAQQQYYLQLYRNEGATTWHDKNSGRYAGSYLYIGPGVYYDNSNYSSYSLPVMFYGSVLKIDCRKNQVVYK